MRNRAFQEDGVKFYQEIEELRRMCCAEAERARQLRIDELSTREEDNKSTVKISVWFKFRNFKTRSIRPAMRENSMILKQ